MKEYMMLIPDASSTFANRRIPFWQLNATASLRQHFEYQYNNPPLLSFTIYTAHSRRYKCTIESPSVFCALMSLPAFTNRLKTGNVQSRS